MGVKICKKEPFRIVTAWLSALDVGFQELHIALDVQLPCGGRQEHGFSGPEHELLGAGLAGLLLKGCGGWVVDSDDSSSTESDENDECVERGEVDGGGLVEVVDGRCEVGTADELLPLVLAGGVVGLIIGQHVVVDAFGGELGVEFAWPSEVVVAVEVVNAVGDVAGLLDFGEEAS